MLGLGLALLVDKDLGRQAGHGHDNLLFNVQMEIYNNTIKVFCLLKWVKCLYFKLFWYT